MRTRTSKIAGCLPLVLMACLCIPSCSDPGKKALDQTTARGDKIIDALERYRADHGRYPTALAEITPKYLSTMEPPLFGARQWSYTVQDDGTAFVLEVKERNDSDWACWYRSKSKTWSVDTK